MSQFLCQVSPTAVFLQRYLKFEWGTNTLWNPVLIDKSINCAVDADGNMDFLLLVWKYGTQRNYCFLKEPGTKLTKIIGMILVSWWSLDQPFVRLTEWNITESASYLKLLLEIQEKVFHTSVYQEDGSKPGTSRNLSLAICAKFLVESLNYLWLW